MSQFWNVRKKSGGRWTAYEVEGNSRPAVKCGYEVNGPHKNIVAAFLAAMKTNKKGDQQ